MNDRDPDRAGAIREIATVLATAYLRLRFPEPPPPAVDCPETKSESCDGGLTILQKRWLARRPYAKGLKPYGT